MLRSVIIRNKIFFFIFLLLLTGFLTPGYVVAQSVFPAPAGEVTLSIGALLPLTGGLTDTGTMAKATLEIAQEDFEREYPSVHLNLLFEDTATDPETGLTKLQSLYSQGVRVFIGPFSSEVLKYVKSFANTNNCILISPTSTALSLALDDNVFRMCTNDKIQSMALADYIQAKNVSYIIPLARSDEYGQGFVGAFQANFQEMGTTLEPIYYDPATTDFQSVITKVADTAQSILQADSSAQVGVLLVSYDEVISIFNLASGNEILSSLRWFGTDSIAKTTLIEQDEVASAFASQIRFTASTTASEAMSHPNLPYSEASELLVTKVLKKIASSNTPIINDVYDSLWLASIAQFNGAENVKEELINASHLYVGMKGTPWFDSNGDSTMAVYALFQYLESKQWALVGSLKGNVLPDGSLYGKVFSDAVFLPDNTDKTASIGALLSLTGDSAESGIGVNHALELAEQHINEILARVHSPNSKIHLLVEDTQSDPVTALQKMKDLAAQGIKYFIGPLTSAELEAMSSFAEENGLLVISPASTSTSLSRKDTIFRMMMNDQKQAKALSTVIKDQGYSQIEVLYRNDTYGAGLYNDLKTAFEAQGGHCGDGISFEVNTTDFNPSIRQLENRMQTHNPNLTAIVVVAYDEIVPLFDTISSSSLLRNFRWFGTDSSANNLVINNDAQASSFAIQTQFTAANLGTEFYSFYYLLAHVLTNELTDQIGSAPRAFDIAAYDSLWMYVNMMEKVSWQIPSDVQQAMEALTTASSQFGIISTFILNDVGDREFGNYTFYQFREENSSPKWILYANYFFNTNNTETLTYFDSEHSSSIQDWDLLR